MKSAIKKLGLGVLAIMLLFGALFAIVYARQNGAEDQTPLAPPPTVRVQPVGLTQHEFTDTFYGQLEPWRKVAMSFEYAGTVEWIRLPEGREIPEGQKVSAKDRLIALDCSGLNAELAAADAELDRNLAVLGIAGSEAQAAKVHLPLLNQLLENARQNDPSVQEAEASVKRATDEFERIQKLYDPDPTKSQASKVEMNRAVAERERTEAVLAAARRLFDQKVAQVQTAQSHVQQIRVRIGKMELLSPIEGFVTEIGPEVGETVSPQTPVVELMDLSRVKAIVGVVDSRVARLREGQTVSVTIDALKRARELADLGVATDVSPQDADAEELERLNKAWTGTVLHVPKRADPASSLFNVEIEIANRFVTRAGLPVPLLRPGMIVRTDIVIDRQPVFKVPQSATVLDRKGLAVYFLSPTTPAGFRADGLVDRRLALPVASARRVTLGDAALIDGFYMLPTPPGAGPTTRPDSDAEVILAGQQKLEDGMPVQVIRD